MPAMSVRMRTKYVCNHGSKRDQICLQCQLGLGPNMPAMTKNFKMAFQPNTITLILGPYQIRVQAYMVPNVTDIAALIGPPDNECNNFSFQSL